MDDSNQPGLIDALRNPLALSRRTLQDLEALGDAARGLADFQRAVLDRLDGLSADVRKMGDELNGSVEDLKKDFERIDRRVTDLQAGLPEVTRDLGETKKLAAQIRTDIRDVVEHLPDPDSRGSIAKARDAITGGDEDEDS